MLYSNNVINDQDLIQSIFTSEEKSLQFKKICVVGLGYIGLPTASMFATHGMRVLGVDTNAQVVKVLQEGSVHIYEPGLRTLVQAAFKSGNLTIRKEPEAADVFIIAVPTPLTQGNKADLSYVKSAGESLLPSLQKGNIVVLESTSPPMTTVNFLAPILEKSGLTAGEDFFLAYSPERVLPGQILSEIIENARVIGGINRASAEAVRDLYALFVRGRIFLTDATTAEMVKLMENTYRDVNIAVANEFARLADRFGVDVWEAISIANYHPRVEILNPGPGVGGHCIGVDPWFLVEAAPDLATLIQTARSVNEHQPEYIVDLIYKGLGKSGNSELSGNNIAILGLAYKPDVDDLRESPAIEIAHLLKGKGAVVSAYEPFRSEFEIAGINVSSNLQTVVQNAGIIALLVGHTQLREMNPHELIKLTDCRVVLDAVNGWNPDIWREAGFKLIRLGVS